MWDAIIKIESYIGARSKDEFLKDDMAYDAVLRQLTVLGEAVSNISPAFRLAHSEIPWSKIVGFRNRLMHEYSNVENDIIWGVFVRDLPALKKFLQPLV